jgi:hypothetical protein
MRAYSMNRRDVAMTSQALLGFHSAERPNAARLNSGLKPDTRRIVVTTNPAIWIALRPDTHTRTTRVIAVTRIRPTFGS